MALPGRLYFLLGLIGFGFFFSVSAYAECGGNTQCIALGATAAAARVAHHGGPLAPNPPESSVFTLDFGNQSATTTSAAKTIFVAAVTGPVGTMAMLGPITLSGAGAADFSITGGTCSPTNGPIQDAATGGGTLCTITVAFNPATLGAKTATVHVPLNPVCGGCITQRTLTLTGIGTAIAAPTAGATTLTVPVNTATTLDLAPFIAGTGITGVAVTAAPTHGVAAVNGTKVTYTPTRDYFGADALSYAAVGSGGSSTPAVVSVTVVGRPDPSKDANVIGLIGAQAQTARRFSRAQIVNFQRRMESLHHGADAGDTAIAGGTGFGAGRGPGPNSASGPVMSRNFFTSPGVGAGAAGSGADIVAGAQPQGPFERAPSDPGRQKGLAGDALALLPTSFATTLLSAATTRSVNLANSSDRAAGSSGLPAGTGMWIGGNLNFGSRDETSDSSSLRFSTNGISVGADRWFSDKLALGLGLGYARDKTDIGTDGTKSRSTGSSIAAYGSYQSSTNTFVDGLIGYGVLGHDTDRYVAAVDDFARAHRNGNQLFGSLAVGYEHRDEGLLLSPYARLDVAIDRLKQTTETGAGLNALTYYDQTLQTRQLSLGLRVESKHETRFGWALPRLRVEFRHDFEGDQHATIAFADQFAGPTYSVMPAGVNRNSQLIGIGSDFLLRDGLKLGIDYQVQRSVGPDSSQAIRLWLSQEFDGKGLRSAPLSSKMFEDPVMVEAGYTWDNNLTRAIDAADKLSDHIYSLNVSKGTIFPVSSDTRMVFTGFLNAEKLHTYTGLDRVSGGIQGEFQYRTSGAFAAPTFGIFGRMTLDDYASQLRSGRRYSFGVSARESLTDRIDAFVALAGNVRDARSDVFDARDRGARFNLDYSLGQDGALYFGGEVRRGDSVSSGRTPLANAKFSVQDDAYGSEPLFAYRYDARTVLWTLGYNWPVGPRDSFDCSWRRAQSTPTQQAGPGGAYGAGSSATASTSRYAANQFSVAYLMRF
jgi:outer membrane autotransporter protein